MPIGAKILCVQNNGSSGPCLWAQVNDSYSKEKRIISIFGTGNPVPDNPMEYIGTYQVPLTSNGVLLVFHVYELLTY